MIAITAAHDISHCPEKFVFDGGARNELVAFQIGATAAIQLPSKPASQ